MPQRTTGAPEGIPLLLVEPDGWRAASLSVFLSGCGYVVSTELKPGVEPAVVLANLAWGGPEVRERLSQLGRELREPRIVAFVADLAPERTFPSLRLRVKGFLAAGAGPEELRAALRCVLDGSIWAPRAVLSQWVDRVARLGPDDAAGSCLTRAERRVLEGVRDDLSNKEIGRRLGVTESTVKFHVGKLLRKTGAASRRELARVEASGGS